MRDFLCPDFLEIPNMYQHTLLLSPEEKRFFRKIYETYREEMFYTAYVILENVQDTEDVLQQTFLALLSNMDKMDENDPRKTWNYIVTIVKNNAINLYNKRKRRTDRELPITEEILKDMVDEDFETKFQQIEQRDFIAKFLAESDELSRDIIILRYYHGMNCIEIAKLLGKTPANVRQIIRRTKKKLQRVLGEMDLLGEPDMF